MDIKIVRKSLQSSLLGTCQKRFSGIRPLRGGWGGCKAEVRPPEVDPYFERKKIALGGVTKSLQAAILTLEQNPPERNFLTYIKIFSQEDFALKSKLRPGGFFQHLPIFAGNSHFTGISQLRAGKTGSKICCTHLSYTFSES